MINTDNMTERITIEKNNCYIDPTNGLNKDEWSYYHKCWSEFKKVGWRNYLSSKAIQAENIVTFIIYYSSKTKELLDTKDPTQDYRLVYKNRIYNIKYVEDIENKHEFIEIKGEAVL